MRKRVAGRGVRYLAGGVAGLLGAVLYSSFPIAGLAGSRLNLMDSFVSELEVPGQPGSGLFRLTGAVCGLLVVAFALALWYRLPHDRSATVGCVCLAVFGLCGVVDARYPLPCTPSTDRSCRRSIDQMSVLVQAHRPHAISGALGVFAVVMAMLLLSMARGIVAWSSPLARACLLSAVLLAVLGLLELALIYAGHGLGVVERVYILLISAWLAVLAGYLARDGLIVARRAGAPHGELPVAHER